MRRIGWRRSIIVSACATLFASGAVLGQVEPTEEVADEAAVEATVNTGQVILDGTYLAPPYVIRTADDELTINGQVVNSSLSTPFRRGGSGPWRDNGGERRFRAGPDRFGWGGGPGMRGPSGRMSPTWRISRRLETGSTFVAFEGHPAVFLDPQGAQSDFFEAVQKRDPSSKAARVLLESLPSDADREVWSKWLAGIEPTDEIWKLADAAVREADAAAAMNQSEVAATRRLNDLTYPLTVAGMVLGVLALGHLLRSFPQPVEGTESPTARAVFMRATVSSLGLVVVLSAMDLIWTLLAAQAGQMRELNPLGSRLIDDPEMLLAFKTTATLVGCGLLFVVRQHRHAQVAAWWMCLLCTVLTFRWVVFNSMFVA